MTSPLPGTDRVVDTRPISRDEWYELAETFLDFGYRHAWDFNVHSAQRQGSRLEHVKVSDGNNVIGLAAVRIKRIPLIGSGVAYIGGGPLTRRGEPDDQDRLARCLAALHEEYVLSRRLVLRISAPVTAPDLVAPTELVYAASGFEAAPNIPGYRTLMLDLATPLEDMRAGFARRWRRDLSRSLKTEWEFEIGTTPELFEQFRLLFERFVDWKAFDVEHDARFHEAIHADLPDDARYLVVLARVEGELGGAIIVTRTGDTAVYLLGAMNPDHRKRAPGYALQWRAVQHLQEIGARWYDMGGIDPEGNEGVYRFKSGMARIDVSAPGPFERGPGGVRRSMVTIAEKAYGGLSRLRRSSS